MLLLCAVANDGYGTVEARAAVLLENVAQGEQAFPGELYNGRPWQTLSGDTMTVATPSCPTPGGAIEVGTAVIGESTDLTATSGGFADKIWRPLAESFDGCCPCTPCLCTAKCASQHAIGEGVLFALTKPSGEAIYKGKLSYWFISLGGQLYLTE